MVVAAAAIPMSIASVTATLDVLGDHFGRFALVKRASRAGAWPHAAVKMLRPGRAAERRLTLIMALEVVSPAVLT